MHLTEALARFKKNKSCQTKVFVFLGQNYTMRDGREAASQTHIDFQEPHDRPSQDGLESNKEQGKGEVASQGRMTGVGRAGQDPQSPQGWPQGFHLAPVLLEALEGK